MMGKRPLKQFDQLALPKMNYESVNPVRVGRFVYSIAVFLLEFSYTHRLILKIILCPIQENQMFREPKEVVKELQEKLQELWRYL